MGTLGRGRSLTLPLLVGCVLAAVIALALTVYLLAQPSTTDTDTVSDEEETASDGGAFDAVFVHRATPENISANSTYLDNPQTNDDPDVILYVTPNWNPGGGSGTYNDHPVGVWYDANAQRWAIFNQD